MGRYGRYGRGLGSKGVEGRDSLWQSWHVKVGCDQIRTGGAVETWIGKLRIGRVSFGR